MFNKRKQQRLREETAERIVDRALKDLVKAGFGNSSKLKGKMLDYYFNHDLYGLDEDLQATTLMMYWLVNKYGTYTENQDFWATTVASIAKPQNSIYFYWLPSQYIRCRQLGGEIQQRVNPKQGRVSPQPNMRQHDLEERYIQTRDVVLMLNNISEIPDKMMETFKSFTKSCDNILSIHKQETIIPKSAEGTIPLANKNQYNKQTVKSMKPKFDEGSYSFTDYLGGSIGVDEIYKIGKTDKQVEKYRQEQIAKQMLIDAGQAPEAVEDVEQQTPSTTVLVGSPQQPRVQKRQKQRGKQIKHESER